MNKPESAASEPESLLRELELELAQKRIAHTQATNRLRQMRALSFALLFLIIAGAFVAFFFLLNSDALREKRATAAETRAQISPAPTAPPSTP